MLHSGFARRRVGRLRNMRTAIVVILWKGSIICFVLKVLTYSLCVHAHAREQRLDVVHKTHRLLKQPAALSNSSLSEEVISRVALRFFVRKSDLAALTCADDSVQHKFVADSDDAGCHCHQGEEPQPLSMAMLLRPSHHKGKIVQPGHRENNKKKGKILGGGDADITEHPYLLQLALNGNQVCGATVIGRGWAITAAHCVTMNDREITLRAGATLRNKGGKNHKIEQKIIHRLYNNITFDYDIALLKVQKPFDFGPTVKPIALHSQGRSIPSGQMGEVSGWGSLEPDIISPSKILQHLKLKIDTKERCMAAYKAVNRVITDHMLCASTPDGGDSCQGDSGGPLIINKTLVGIISWGRGCALPEFPGVYTRIAKFRRWIKEKTGI